jgi:arachidonate 15-lipoxygenase
MPFHIPPSSQQGHYRYDPSTLEHQGPARLFPFVGEDGTLRYLIETWQQHLTKRGLLSAPWSLSLAQVDRGLVTLKETWNRLTTLLADWEVLQSDWFNFNLPPGEQFSSPFVRERRSMATALLAAKEAAQQVAPGADLTQRQRCEFYHQLKLRQRDRPVITRIAARDGGLSDREFARQRVAGQNPMVLRRVLAVEPVVELSAGITIKSLADDRPLDLAAIAAANRLFVADYPILRELSVADLQPGRYVGSPIAVFYRAETGLEPILIQVEPNRMVTPTDGDDWMRAKLYVQTADVTHHELIAHLCDTHLAMEAFAIATPRQLPHHHPVAQLLRPHFQFLLAINTRGNHILLGEGAAIDQLLAPTRLASIGLINRAYRARSFQDFALPTNIQQRGIEAEFLPEFPYRDDALLLWNAIQRYVTHYLNRAYADDQAVQQDPYLQAWATELGAPLHLGDGSEFPAAPAWFPPPLLPQTGLVKIGALPTYARVPDFPAKATDRQPLGVLTGLQTLIDVVTQVIFTCGPQHAAVNFSQFDYVGYPPNAPLALYSRPDTPVPLASFLPNPQQDLAQIELTFALSGIRWGQLGSSELIQFTDPGDRRILSEFQAELKTIESKINDRNQQRAATSGVEYPYLLPSRIPNSINI